MKILTAKDIKLMGVIDPKYGQSYWGTVEESNDPVMFNLMQQVDIQPGRQLIAGEWAMKTSSKGNDYMQLKKVKLSEPSASVPTSVAEELELDESEEMPQGWLLDEETQLVHVPESEVGMSLSDDTPSYEAGTNARWAIGLAYRAYQQVMGTPEDGSGEFPFHVVKLHARNLVQMFNELKTPGYDKAKVTANKLRKEE